MKNQCWDKTFSTPFYRQTAFKHLVDCIVFDKIPADTMGLLLTYFHWKQAAGINCGGKYDNNSFMSFWYEIGITSPARQISGHLHFQQNKNQYNYGEEAKHYTFT
jgi:hypothetical protein